MPNDTVRCGTISGYTTHRKHKETPCDECRAAWNAYGRAHRAKWKRTKRRPLSERLAEQQQVSHKLAAALVMMTCNNKCEHRHCAQARAALTLWESTT